MPKVPIHVGDLTDQTGHVGARPVLYCRVCGEQSSANARDYFALPPEYVFKCCGELMRLVTVKSVVKNIKQRRIA